MWGEHQLVWSVQMRWAADREQKKNQIGSQPEMQTVFEVKMEYLSGVEV